MCGGNLTLYQTGILRSYEHVPAVLHNLVNVL